MWLANIRRAGRAAETPEIPFQSIPNHRLRDNHITHRCLVIRRRRDDGVIQSSTAAARARDNSISIAVRDARVRSTAHDIISDVWPPWRDRLLFGVGLARDCFSTVRRLKYRTSVGVLRREKKKNVHANRSFTLVALRFARTANRVISPLAGRSDYCFAGRRRARFS